MSVPTASLRSGIARAALAAAILAGGGCGGSTAAPSPGSAQGPAQGPAQSPATGTSAPPVAAAPATGARVIGEDYSFRMPKGWRDYTKELDNDRVDRAAASARGARSSVNVVLTDQSITSGQLDAVLATIRDKILPSAPAYEVLPEITVAGVRAGHLGGLRTQDNAKYWLEQFVFGHGAHTYIVSFSFPPKVRAAARSRTIGSVLATWRWS